MGITMNTVGNADWFYNKVNDVCIQGIMYLCMLHYPQYCGLNSSHCASLTVFNL